MPIYTNNTFVGIDSDARFVSNTRTWRGGGLIAVPYSSGTGGDSDLLDFAVNSGATLTAIDCNVDCRLFGTAGSLGATQSTGSMVLTNATITNFASTNDGATSVNTPGANVNQTWRNVRFRSPLPLYSVIGRWGTGTAPTWDLANVNIESDLVPNRNLFVGFNMFLGNVNIDRFDEVSFWNGVDLQTSINSATANTALDRWALIKGGVPQLNPVGVFSGTVIGPMGTVLNNDSNDLFGRTFLRLAPQNFTIPAPVSQTVNTNNHCGFLLNTDFRALSQITSQRVGTADSELATISTNLNVLRWQLVVDGETNAWLVNPLVGRPDGQAGILTISSYFNSFGRLRVLTGTNPAVTGSEHWCTFSQSQVDAGVFTLPTTLSPTGVTSTGIPTVDGSTTGTTSQVSSRAIQHGSGNNGILFTNQLASPAASEAYPGRFDTASRIAFAPLTTQNFRKYSWAQQDNNYDAATNPGGFGKLISVRPPVEGAYDNLADADAAVTRGTINQDTRNSQIGGFIDDAVAGGYDRLDGTGWTTSTD